MSVQNVIQVPDTEYLQQALPPPSGGQVVIVADTARGGSFVFDSSGPVAQQNNGTIFARLDAQGQPIPNGGIYRRIYDGYVNVKWFGAKGMYDPDNPAQFDDTAAIQAAIDFLATPWTGNPGWGRRGARWLFR